MNNSSRWLLVGESGTGTLNISGNGQVTTANVIRVGHTGGTGTINLNGGTLTTLGIQRGTGSATLNFNGGTVTPTADSATFLQGMTAANVQTGGAVFNTAGRSITVAQALAHDSTLGATPDGGLTKNGLGTLTLSAISNYTGLTKVNVGTLVVNGSIAGAVNVNSGGALAGSGTVVGLATVASGGILSPGSSPGVLTLGALALQTGSQTNVEIGGVTRGSQYDAIDSSGAVGLGGALNVSLIGGYSPVPGAATSFNILDWGSLTGKFSNVQLPTLPAPMGWDLSQLYATGTITATPDVPGDFNRDGQVTVADVSAMVSALSDLNDYQSANTLTTQQLSQIGDLNGDGIVNNADLQGLISSLASNTSGGGSLTAVPEPIAAIPMTIGATIFALRILRNRATALQSR